MRNSKGNKMVGYVIAFLSGLIITSFGTWFAYYLSNQSQGELVIIEDGIDFYGSAHNEKAIDFFNDEDGLALIVSLDVDCKIDNVLLSRSRLEVKTRNKKAAIMLGNIYDDKSTIKIEKGEIASVRLIFNPSQYVKNLAELRSIFSGAVYSLELFDSEGEKVAQINSKRIKEIRTINSKKIYKILIPPITEMDDAQRIMDILKANDIGGIELKEERIDEESYEKKVIDFRRKIQ